MPYPFHLLEKEKIPAPAQDVETFIRHALGQHGYIVKRTDLDKTGKRFQLDFWHRDIGLDKYMTNGKVAETYWGGAQIIEWSDSTEIVRMWAAIPENWYIGEFDLDKDEVMEERFGSLEELSDEIREHFMPSTSRKQDVPMPQSPENNDKDVKRNVFVVHGRNGALRQAMFDFLRSIGLNPIEWTQAISMTEKGSPFVGEVLDTAMKQAQAIVVLFTGDDEAKLKEEFLNAHDSDYERNLTPQARPNVLFEAGMAFGKFPDRTILVQVGPLRPFSDIAGRHMIHLANDTKTRQDLVQRLSNAGCAVNSSGTDWHTTGDFSEHVSPMVAEKATQSQSVGVAALTFPPEETLSTIATENGMEVNKLKVLIAMANAPGFSPGSANAEVLGQLASMNAVKAEHYCETLAELDFIDTNVWSSQYGRIYVITPPGRAFLVKHNLI